MRKTFTTSIATIALVFVAPTAFAAWPERPVKIVVGYPPGAAVDQVVRKVAEHLQRQTGQPFVIENKPSVGGMIAASQVANAAPDGYTLIAYDDTYVVLGATTKNLAVNTVRSFAPITALAYTPGLLVVPANSPFKTLGDLIAHARSHPGQINYGAGPFGGALGMATEDFRLAAGIQIQSVPFKGGAETVQNLMSNTIDMALLSTPSVAGQIANGRLRGLAVAAPTRLKLLPNVPTFAEAGLRNYSFVKWTGMAAPAATPKPVLTAIHAQIREALQSADFQVYLDTNEARAGGESPEEFGRQIDRESQRWTELWKKVEPHAPR